MHDFSAYGNVVALELSVIEIPAQTRCYARLLALGDHDVGEAVI